MVTAADGTQTTRSAQSVSELSDSQRKAYKADLIDYQVWDKYANKITHGIKAVDDAVKLLC
jgi:sensor domain CHASE-containing protein